MDQKKILKKVMKKAIKGGWLMGEVCLDDIKEEFKGYDLNATLEAGYGLTIWFIYTHEFAKAFFKDIEIPDSEDCDYDKYKHTGEKLGLYVGGGYEGYGDRCLFLGEPWQYHLQQMVLEEDPIKYLEKFI